MSEQLDPRIGVYDEDGAIIVRPDKTLSGKPVTRPYAATTRLDATHFVVQDSAVHTAPGYDIEAAIKRLKRKLDTGSEEEAVTLDSVWPVNSDITPPVDVARLRGRRGGSDTNFPIDSEVISSDDATDSSAQSGGE